MKPLIVAATQLEILDSIPLLEKKEIPYLITGVGMTATAFALGKKIGQAAEFSHILNVGIAGSFDKSIPLGTVLSVKSDTFYELGAEDGDTFISIEELGFGIGTYYAKNINPPIDLPSYDGITVNKVHGDKSSIQRAISIYPNIKVESMEGAAVFYACKQENLPCAQIRAISNYVEPRDRSKWNVKLAIENLNSWLKFYINSNYPD